ncbi:MAG TPA: hypothetical protein VMU09_10515 [Acidimicrobiales bacterium]|nr:hypothetical protein [Acidimicrobiales bacterium]
MSEFVNEWAPRIGEEASRLQVRGTRLLLLGAASGATWIVTQVLGAALRAASLELVAACLLALAVALLAAGAYVINRSHRSMSLHLGVKVQFLEGPRLHPDTFRRWCQHHGVDVHG